MPIRLKEVAEPLSPVSAELPENPGIESDAERILVRDLERYCRGQMKGRSFLISGHRGAGKTTLVKRAVENVRRHRDERGSHVQLLLVEVNGPTLFPEPEPSPHRPVRKGRSVRLMREAAAPATAAGKRNLALKQIVLALHRAVAEEMCRAFRQRAGTTDEGLELAAALELELFECPVPARLREFWRRGGFLPRGVLFRRAAPVPAGYGRRDVERPDQAYRELLALASVCEAYCRVSGTLNEEQKRSDSAERAASVSVSGEPKAGELIGAGSSLLVGGAVGVGVQASGAGSGLAATAAGIAAALGAAAVFKYSASRSSARSVSRELKYLRDLSVDTLDRFIPMLVERLFSAGIAPVFLVDELDKVDNLTDKMLPLLENLKKLFAENAFFCFVTGRGYYEEFRRRAADRVYPKEWTYFGHELFLVYGHADLHRYLRERLEVVPPRTVHADAAKAVPDTFRG